jgi:hypothetical protein
VPAAKPTSAKKLVKKPAARTQPRVKQTEEKSRAARKTAAHREVESPVKAMVQDLGGGEVLIVSQISELVPVAQFANVTLGPNMIGFKMMADLSILADVNWDDEAELTEEQQAVYDRVMNALKGLSNVLQVHLADDREMVLTSVAEQNAREESEASATRKKKQTRARRQ